LVFRISNIGNKTGMHGNDQTISNKNLAKITQKNIVLRNMIMAHSTACCIAK